MSYRVDLRVPGRRDSCESARDRLQARGRPIVSPVITIVDLDQSTAELVLRWDDVQGDGPLEALEHALRTLRQGLADAGVAAPDALKAVVIRQALIEN